MTEPNHCELEQEVKRFADIERLTAESSRLQAAIKDMQEGISEVEQVLGCALGYPRYSNDPKNFPDAAGSENVCTGEHTAVTLAMQAATHIRGIEEEVKRLIAQLGSAQKEHAAWVANQDERLASRWAEMKRMRAMLDHDLSTEAARSGPLSEHIKHLSWINAINASGIISLETTIAAVRVWWAVWDATGVKMPMCDAWCGHGKLLYVWDTVSDCDYLEIWFIPGQPMEIFYKDRKKKESWCEDWTLGDPLPEKLRSHLSLFCDR